MEKFSSYFVVILLSIVFCINLFASEIELTDGSTLVGDVKAVNNNYYTIKTESMGTVKIDASRVSTVRNSKSSIKSKSNKITIRNEAPSVNAVAADQIESLKQVMMTDPSITHKIMALHDDPQFKSVMQDKQIMQAVQNQDLDFLMNNQKFMGLLNHSVVGQIKNDVGVR